METEIESNKKYILWTTPLNVACIGEYVSEDLDSYLIKNPCTMVFVPHIDAETNKKITNLEIVPFIEPFVFQKDDESGKVLIRIEKKNIVENSSELNKMFILQYEAVIKTSSKATITPH